MFLSVIYLNYLKMYIVAHIKTIVITLSLFMNQFYKVNQSTNDWHCQKSDHN